MTKIVGVPPTPIDKMFSPRIWTNLKNDPDNVKKRGIPRIRGSLTCLAARNLRVKTENCALSRAYMCKFLHSNFSSIIDLYRKMRIKAEKLPI